jgi:hypothetical protein
MIEPNEVSNEIELTPEQIEELYESQCESAASTFIAGMAELGLPFAQNERFGGKILARLIELNLDPTNSDDYFKSYVSLQAEGYFDKLAKEIATEEADNVLAPVVEKTPHSVVESGLITHAVHNMAEIQLDNEAGVKARKLSDKELKAAAIADRRSRMSPENLRAQDAGLRLY